MYITKISILKPIMMVMIILALVIFGLLSFTRLPIDMMPDVELPYVTIQALYPGAGPEEIESSVVEPIEDQLLTINGLKNVTSYCRESVGFIILEFNLDVDPDLAAIDVKDKVDVILYQLPEDMDRPIISKFDINAQSIMNLAVTGPGSPENLRRVAEKQVEERLLKIPGVASIDVTGGREREIQVNLEKEKLDGLNISIFQVISALARQSANFPAGHLSGDRREFTVRVTGEFESIEEIAALQVPTSNGPVRLSSIASVEDTYKEVREKARFNGENSVGLAILKRPDANTVEVAELVLGESERLERGLPPGYRIGIASNRSQFIRDSVNDTYTSMFLGILLTSLILLFFLHEWKLTLIAAITMPASVIVTFIGMQLLGFTLNIVTLMALAISIGILVTNAIVVLENVVRHRNEGMDIREAAEKGTGEIAVAVMASTLTNIAVFLPIATMSGITGQFFKALGLTIAMATVVSLLLSFTLTPLMASRILKTREKRKEDLNWLDRRFDAFQGRYLALLERVIRRRRLAFLSVIVLLVLTFMLVFPRLGSEFFPESDQGLFTIDLEMPPGTSLDHTDAVLSDLEMRVSGLPEIETVYSSLGGSDINAGVNIGQLLVQLKDRNLRERSTARVVNDIRLELIDIPDARIVVKEASMMGPQGAAGDIQAEVTGDEMGEILTVANAVLEEARAVPGLTDTNLSWSEAKPEMKFLPDRMRMDHYGVTVADMGATMRFSMTGSNAAVYREERDEYDIRVRYGEEDRDTLDEVENISIATGRGFMPVRALAEVVYEKGAAGIDRKNRQRMVVVSTNVAGGAAGTMAAELKRRTDRIDLEPGYRIFYGGEQEMMRESFMQLILAAMLAIVLTYMVLAGILESLRQPFIIMLTLPLGAIGVVWALFLTGNTISMMSLMSVVMLIGIVVNNAILILNYAHERRREGDTPTRAVLKACGVKFKAILMMNLAIILAMLPQALGMGSGGEMRAPFAITAVGGILLSTLLTLFMIPPLYVMTAKKSRD